MQARFYEVVYEIYQIIIPIHSAKRQFKELEKIHVKLVECFQNIVSKVTNVHKFCYHSISGLLYCREIREVLVPTLGLVSMVIFLVKVMLMGKSLSTESKVSPDWLNSL